MTITIILKLRYYYYMLSLKLDVPHRGIILVIPLHLATFLKQRAKGKVVAISEITM